MSTLFAFLHHVSAFTLACALAVEFILIGQMTLEQGVMMPLAKVG